MKIRNDVNDFGIKVLSQNSHIGHGIKQVVFQRLLGPMSKQHRGHIETILTGVDYIQRWDNFYINKNNK